MKKRLYTLLLLKYKEKNLNMNIIQIILFKYSIFI